MSATPENPGITPADLAVVASYGTRHEAHDRGLVALSMGLPYWVLPHEGRYHLLVETEELNEVAREVAEFDDEPPMDAPPADPHVHESDTTLYLCYAYSIFLAAAFLFQKSQEPWSTEAFGNDTLAVFLSGEWWRTGTALALHSDLGHLLGNIGFGIWFAVLAARALGPWVAALGFLLSGMLGNALSAWIYFPHHSIAIGASTAVFGTLGLLVGNGLFNSLHNRSLMDLSSKLAPLAGGLALLALTGAGGPNTDVLAHCCGFLAGIPLGIAATWAAPYVRKTREISIR